MAFMCQQALEKTAKGLYAYYVDENIPRIHNISFILGKVAQKIEISLEEDMLKVLDKLAAYYIQGRYPSYKEKAFQSIDNKEAKEILSVTKEIFTWLKSLKK